jgi:RNA polymerase sigma-70 factor (ECF subfamily)
MRMVGLNDADDLLQQVFLQVFRSLSQFSGQSRFETWLYRVSVNESLQHLRKQRRRRWVSLEGDFMDRQPDQERDFDHKELMEHALARLEPELRSLFLLREVEKQSYAEIAAVMQIPEGTVASRLSRARQLLKQYLVELGWEP